MTGPLALVGDLASWCAGIETAGQPIRGGRDDERDRGTGTPVGTVLARWRDDRRPASQRPPGDVPGVLL